jgi:hypothetical protein
LSLFVIVLTSIVTALYITRLGARKKEKFQVDGGKMLLRERRRGRTV